MDNLSGYEKVIFENNCEAMILNQYQRSITKIMIIDLE